MVVVLSVVALGSTGAGWWASRGVLAGFTVSQALPTDGARSTDGAINLLLIGLDSRKDQQGNDLPQPILDQLHAGDSQSGGYNTNTLILVHLSADNRVTAFSIPRDDYIAFTALPGYDHIKIKEAYGLTKAHTEQSLLDAGVTDPATLESRGREAGRSATLAAVRTLVDVPIDYFAEISLAGFYDLAATLGGIEVCLNQPTHDDYSGADFPAGRQTLDAAQALAFVRQRHGLTNGDLDRTHRQQAFLVSLMRQLQNTGTFSDLTHLNALLTVARRDIVLSSGWDTALFRRLGAIAGGDVVFQTLPVLRYDTIGGQDVNVIDPAQIKAQIRAAFVGNTTAAPPSTQPTITVDVLNAGSIPGLAATTSAALAGHGYTPGEVRNAVAGEPSTTAIGYGTNAGTEAQAIAGLLGISTTHPDPALSPTHVRVVLGPEYTSPDGNGSAGGESSTAGPTDTVSVDAVTDAPAPDHGPPVDGRAVPCVN